MTTYTREYEYGTVNSHGLSEGTGPTPHAETLRPRDTTPQGSDSPLADPVTSGSITKEVVNG